jgi:hypothetical protein
LLFYFQSNFSVTFRSLHFTSSSYSLRIKWCEDFFISITHLKWVQRQLSTSYFLCFYVHDNFIKFLLYFQGREENILTLSSWLFKYISIIILFLLHSFFVMAHVIPDQMFLLIIFNLFHFYFQNNLTFSSSLCLFGEI